MKLPTALALIFFPALTIATPYNMSYVEVNDNQLSNVGCFVNTKSNKPFFDMVGIFAANINGSSPNSPEIYFNPQVDKLLNQTNQVSMLQAQGIKVLLTLLGNHQNAGWACMTDEKAIQSFANDVVQVVTKYNLDGIDIDDEYSQCASNDSSLIRITKAIKDHPKFKGKILSKALYADYQYFSSEYKGMKLADFIDHGWEMSYGASTNRLSPYVNYGMSKPGLALGVSTSLPSSYAQDAARYIVKNNFGGVMVYNVRKDSFSILNDIAKAENRGALKTLPKCLH